MGVEPVARPSTLLGFRDTCAAMMFAAFRPVSYTHLTANTMCALAEAMGMTLPDGGTAPATSSIRMMKAEETGVKIMELVKKNITSRQIITDSSIRNAIKACLAMSGSTNAVMHLTAIAYEAELGIKVLDEFDTLSDTTPQLAKMNPSCKYLSLIHICILVLH